jgi:prepilin-type N-terminal cleavage/methylation domain-containing protein
MKRKKKHLGFTITELILAIAVSSILVLTIGVVMVDTQKGWMDSYAKVHGGATADAMMTKAAFDKVIRKASIDMHGFTAQRMTLPRCTFSTARLKAE